ncbi:MAG: lysoplasmalogenase [Saprospiraceae bacterium]|nr:lysoplasmalogenase [Saprospiraceae bacterium]
MAWISIPGIKRIFFTVVCTYLILSLCCSGSFLLFILKPAIVGTLIWWVIGVKPPEQRLVFALSFSLLGDTLLMFAADQFSLFLGGLVAFLITHLIYIAIFLRNVRFSDFMTAVWIPSLILLIAFAGLMLSILLPVLGELALPVILYMIVIISMAFFAINRIKQVSRRSYIFVVIGALLFVASDSILALNKFHSEINHSGFYVMLTYSFAQFCLVTGLTEPQDGS